MFPARVSLALGALLVAGCGGLFPPASPAALAPPLPAAPRVGVEVREASARPAVALVVREGDPRAAVALAVATEGGSAASVALAALVQARLVAAGFDEVEARPDRDGYRVRALVDGAAGARAMVAALARATSAELAPGSPEAAVVARYLAALARRPLDGAPRAAVARCSGELGLGPGERAPDASTPAGVAAVEAWRRRAHVTGRMAIGVTGPRAIGEEVAAAVRQLPGWAEGAAGDDPWPARDEAGASVGAARSQARLTVAARVADPVAAATAAERLGAPGSPLLLRLAALAPAWRVREVGVTARLRGACVAVELEAARAVPFAAADEPAARAAAVVLQETARALGAAEPDPRAPGLLRPAAAAGDPRDSAALAAWWSLARVQPGAPTRHALALALPAPRTPPREAGAEPSAVADAVAARLGAALARASSEPPIERRLRVERGQGELWVLLASPCGTSGEGEADAGATALAAIAAVAAREPDADGVTLEPWIAPDGVGVLAHAPRRPDESATAHAQRVADEAARVLLAPGGANGATGAASGFALARASLLDRIGEGAAADGRALGGLAGALAPGHPSWVAPLGTWEAIARMGAEAAAMRWGAVADGPLRVAVLAAEDDAQAAAAARTVEHWLPRGAARACPAVDALAPAQTGSVVVDLASSAWTAQALVAVPAPAAGAPGRELAETTALALSGADGWLARALAADLGVTASARLVGGDRRAALVVDVRGPDDRIEPAVAQVRALFQRLAQGAAAPVERDRAASLRARRLLEGSLDPHRRVAALWRGSDPGEGAPFSIDAWRAFHAAIFRDEATIVAVARPKR